MYIQDLIAKTHPSRISLTYATTVNGEPEVIDLPFRMLVLGDFSQSMSSQPTVPLEDRTMHRLDGSNLNDVMRAMALNLTLTGVPDKVQTPPRQINLICTLGGPLLSATFTAQIGAEKPAAISLTRNADGTITVELADKVAKTRTLLLLDDDLGQFRAEDAFVVTPASKVLAARTNVGSGLVRVVKVTSENAMTVRLPLTGMDAFSPDEIAKNVPAISALRRVKKLLLDMQADLDNRRDLRDQLNGILGNPDLRKTLRASFVSSPQLRLLPGDDTPAAAPANGASPAAGPPDPLNLGAFDLDFSPDTDSIPPKPDASLTATTKADVLLKSLLQEAGMDAKTTTLPTLTQSLDELERASLSGDQHFLARLGALLTNVYVPSNRSLNKSRVLDAIALIDDLVEVQMNEILRHDLLKSMAAAWGALENLVDNTDFSDQIRIDVLDVSKKDLQEDFDSNQSDIFSGALFKKIYIDEYDQYGGLPYGALVGLYEFANIPADLRWLRQMAKVANASHAPFLAAAASKFFGCDSADEVAAIKDIRGLLGQPQYDNWGDFRDLPEAAYIGLALPRFMLRAPWNKDTNPCDDLPDFSEETDAGTASYLWGNPAVLVARNLLRSFNDSGWCQYLRGPKGGGRITGLPAAFYELHDHQVLKPPVEIVIPDYREYEFAQSGFIPLILKKDSTEATFFSVQSIKRPAKLKDPKDNQNAQLVCNLAYTFSITRIAHYVKCIMRDNIGSVADAPYIQQVLSSWLSDYVTEVAKPDDLTVQRFPFKAASVLVAPSVRDIGRYECAIAILPHVQFEGMDVTLRLESRLGK